ncbi:peptidase M4 [Alteromonas sp. V450]|uniref:PepSY domain-containing protein n=1 Tax=Alteromonas sp. V450 TaxID=1912139 RepID=UPI0008FF37BE|nr:PepSY domain-containing protein [Alteromonas sp. V450]OJF67633.1 peptidase M4 [Alteromonas sp. V450]|tara:strand:- start:305 stop:574 length:270 start_codon:yes stop_codon:yes gene_type:complete
MTLSLRVAILTLVLALSGANNAMALQSSSGDISKSEAAERARNAENGRVLKVEQTSKKYRVKVLKKSGRVVSVDVDKRSGKVKSTKDKE